jgi:hypothetical protein
MKSLFDLRTKKGHYKAHYILWDRIVKKLETLPKNEHFCFSGIKEDICIHLCSEQNKKIPKNHCFACEWKKDYGCERCLFGDFTGNRCCCGEWGEYQDAPAAQEAIKHAKEIRDMAKDKF